MFRLALLGLGLVASAASAHQGGEKQIWNTDDGWLLAGTDEVKGEMTFVSSTRVLRAGSAAQVETLRVHRDVDTRFGTDQAHYHLLVDCDDLSWTRISFRGYRPDGSSGPLITKDIGLREAPPEGGIMRRAFDVACGIDAAENAIIADPYSHAKAYFAG